MYIDPRPSEWGNRFRKSIDRGRVWFFKFSRLRLYQCVTISLHIWQWSVFSLARGVSWEWTVATPDRLQKTQNLCLLASTPLRAVGLTGTARSTMKTVSMPISKARATVRPWKVAWVPASSFGDPLTGSPKSRWSNSLRSSSCWMAVGMLVTSMRSLTRAVPTQARKLSAWTLSTTRRFRMVKLQNAPWHTLCSMLNKKWGFTPLFILLLTQGD